MTKRREARREGLIEMFVRLGIAALAAMVMAVPVAAGQTNATPPAKTTPVVGKTGHVKAGKVPGSEKFTTVAAAQKSCPGDTVVWSSFSMSHSFHMSTSRYFGKTKHGAYVCQQAALAAGFHQAKT
jgi:hypothetical protein